MRHTIGFLLVLLLLLNLHCFTRNILTPDWKESYQIHEHTGVLSGRFMFPERSSPTKAIFYMIPEAEYTTGNTYYILTHDDIKDYARFYNDSITTKDPSILIKNIVPGNYILVRFMDLGTYLNRAPYHTFAEGIDCHGVFVTVKEDTITSFPAAYIIPGRTLYNDPMNIGPFSDRSPYRTIPGFCKVELIYTELNKNNYEQLFSRGK